MSSDVITDVLAKVASSKMLWAFIVLHYLKFLARESHHWFVTPKDRFIADPPLGFGPGWEPSGQTAASMTDAPRTDDRDPDPGSRESSHGEGASAP